MRINSVTSANYINKANRLSFGRFSDENARRVAREALKDDDQCMQDIYDCYFKRLDKFEPLEIYTDNDAKTTIKGRFDKKFIEEADKNIMRRINRAKKFGYLEDLSKLDNIDSAAELVRSITNYLNGNTYKPNTTDNDSDLPDPANDDVVRTATGWWW